MTNHKRKNAGQRKAIEVAQSKSDEAKTGDPSSYIGRYLEVIGLDAERAVVVIKTGATHEEYVKFPPSLLVPGKHAMVQELLLKNGLFTPLRRIPGKEVVSFLLDAAETSRVRVIDHPGVHDLKIDGAVFKVLVAGGKYFWLGDQPKTGGVVLVGAARRAPKSSRTIAAFNERIAPILRGSPRILVVLAIALAAPLVRLFGRTPVSLAIIGQSSQGKTVVQRFVSQLVVGHDGVRQLSGTPIGIHDNMVAQGDQPAFYDDMHLSAAASALLQAIMESGNAGGRMISVRSNAGPALDQVTCTLILSGERNIAEIASTANQPINSGIYARVLEMYLGPNGMFDDICGRPDAATLAMHIHQAGTKYAGAVGQAFARAIAKKWEKVKGYWDIKRPVIRTKILEAAQVEELDPISGRLLDGLCFAAFAGCLLQTLKIVDIPRRSIYDAFGLVFREHMQKLNSATSPLAQQVIEAVRLYIQTHPAKFVLLDQAGEVAKQNGMAGYLKRNADGTENYLFFTAFFKLQFVETYGDEVYSHLRDAGYLRAQKARGNQTLVRIPNSGASKDDRQSFIAISSAILYAVS